MIGTKTVFVLGAGASKPFGLPLGIELKNLVLQNYSPNTPDSQHRAHLFNTTDFTERHLSEFIEALRYSGLLSVDAFLERRPEFMPIGKATMAIELLLKEHHNNLWTEGSNWLLYLYSAMIGNSLDQFAKNSVSFVTFNYDRSVEHFFSTSLANSFGRRMEDVKQILDQIPIIHLHGRLGHLPWQVSSPSVEYGKTTVDKLTMEIFLREIKIVHEDITDGRDKDFLRAKQLLAEAKRVYLLGFGFGALNIERLGLENVEAGDYDGTALHLTGKEAEQRKRACGGRINLRDEDSLDLLRRTAKLD